MTANGEKYLILDHSKKILVAPQGEVVKAIEEIKPVKILTTPKGETVFDMGQNMVGWVKLKGEWEKRRSGNFKICRSIG